jgi:Family of unknown function (DUF6428)
MKLSEFKTKLENLETINFYLPNGQMVPKHFHITEVGMTTKNFTDCGNTFRIQKTATMQLWTSIDYWHRLDPKMIVKIIDSTEKVFEGDDLDIEIEYQQETIGKFGLDFIDNKFMLTNKQTDCLAKDSCGLPIEKVKIKLGELQEQITNCCSPNSGCC